MKQWIVVMIFGLLGLTLAQNRSLETAKALYAKGEFKAAAELAEDIQTSAAQAFAARANSTYAQELPENKQEAAYAQSEKYARKGVEIDAKNPDAHFEVARALGRLSQLRGVLAALSQGLGSQIRESLENALSSDPKHAESMVAYGLWHAEIVSKGVGWLYGASPEAAINFFERAVKLEPKQIIAKVEYAHGLVLIDKKRYLSKAVNLLEEAIKLKPNDAAEALDLARAKRDLQALGGK
jgi:tetratricopeptide (TPR) repeat protein